MDDNVLVESAAKEKKSGCAIASLVLGIISLVTLCTTGSVLGLAGIILAIIALAVRKEPKRGMAIGGLITSIIGFVVGVILIAAVVLSMNMVKTTLLERGMTEEQIEVLGEIFTPQQIADYSKLYFVGTLIKQGSQYYNAIWVTNDITRIGAGIVFSVNDYAVKVSGMGDARTNNEPITEHDDGYSRINGKILKDMSNAIN